MNQRIRELADEAAKYSAVMALPTGQSGNELFVEKFAELIVGECANQCDLLLDRKISSEWARGTHDCSKAIKKHFGVKT
jgi:hypothetical protein